MSPGRHDARDKGRSRSRHPPGPGSGQVIRCRPDADQFPNGVKEWKIDPVSLLDPETNIRLGVKILRDEIDTRHELAGCGGKYHSPDPLRGRQYACMVSRYIKGGIRNCAAR